MTHSAFGVWVPREPSLSARNGLQGLCGYKVVSVFGHNHLHFGAELHEVAHELWCLVSGYSCRNTNIIFRFFTSGIFRIVASVLAVKQGAKLRRLFVVIEPKF